MDVLMRCYDIAREHDKRRKPGEVSWELLMVVGLNTSLRVSDLTRFRVRGQALPADESPQYHRLALPVKNSSTPRARRRCWPTLQGALMP